MSSAYHEDMTIWVGSTSLRWRTELRFFEERAALLRHFDDKDILQAFNWREQSIEFRVGDFTTVVIESTGMNFRVATPKKPTSECEIVLKSIMEILQPKDVALGRTQYQVLLELQGESATAQRESARLFPGSEITESEYLDWAMLADGRSSVVDKNYQIEFGVLSPGEAVGRLTGARQSLRIQQADTQNPIDVQNLPEFSLYLKWWWESLDRLPDDNVLVGAFDHWNKMEAETARISASICEQLGLHARLDSSTEEGI